MKKKKTLSKVIYKGLGFPIILLDVPIKEVFGEEVFDINLNQLQITVLQCLAYKIAPLNGSEVCFIRKYFQMNSTDFGKLFGVTHAAVHKWESEKSRVNPGTEICLRLYILDRLQVKDKEFRNFYHEISVKSLAEYDDDIHLPIEINAKEKLFAA